MVPGALPEEGVEGVVISVGFPEPSPSPVSSEGSLQIWSRIGTQHGALVNGSKD